MSKILLLTPFVPSNIGAGVNYTRLFIEDISRENDIDIILFKTQDELSYSPCNSRVKILKEYNANFVYKLLNCSLLFFLFPLFTAKFNVRILLYLRALIKRNDYDIVYFDFSQMFLYAKFLKHKNKVLMSHDVITQRYLRMKHPIISKFCFLTEKWILSTKNGHIFTFSQKDSNLIYSYFKQKSTPTTFYLSRDTIDASLSQIGDYFVLFAMWKRADNYEGLDWFLKYVYSDLDENIKIKIIGSGLNEKLKERISCYNEIEYLGFVDNPYPIIANAKALISPLFTGAGVKVKVIESLACGTPVIGTDISFEGIDEGFSNFMLLANSPEDYIRKIKTLDIPLCDRFKFKSDFIANYSNKSIIQYINSI